MPDVSNIEFLNSEPFELPPSNVEDVRYNFLDSQFFEVPATEIQVSVPNVEVIGEAPPPPTPVAPVVSNFSPVVASAISATTPLQFDVTDDSGLFRDLIVLANFASLEIYEVVHADGAFAPNYAVLSNRSPITGGFHYNVLREGGWPSSPTFVVKAIDLEGSENT